MAIEITDDFLPSFPCGKSDHSPIPRCELLTGSLHATTVAEQLSSAFVLI
jgi:hypothetical protein